MRQNASATMPSSLPRRKFLALAGGVAAAGLGVAAGRAGAEDSAAPRSSDVAGPAVDLMDFAEEGRITVDSIIQATEAAEGRAVVFPANQTLLLPSGRLQQFRGPVHWRADGPAGCTLKIDPDSEPSTQAWWTFLGPVIMDGIHFDGSDLQNKGLRFSPRPQDSVVLINGSSHHWKQRADENEDPIGGFAAGMESHGRYDRLYVERFHFHHCSADAKIGNPRPNTRGANFSTSPLEGQHEGEEGAPRFAHFQACDFYWIQCGDYWGQGAIDADGIVWRNLRDGASRCLIKDCRFWACAKRPIKMNRGDECTVVDCLFTEEELPEGGYTRYRNLAFQNSSGVVRGCVWDFPAAAAWPSQGLFHINNRGGDGVVLTDQCRVRVRDNEPVEGTLFGVRKHSAEPFSTAGMMLLRGWSVEVPGGIQTLVSVRLDGHDTPTEARLDGPRVKVSDLTLSRLNGEAWRLVNAAERGVSYIAVWLNDILILEGQTDPASFTVESGGAVEFDVKS